MLSGLGVKMLVDVKRSSLLLKGEYYGAKSFTTLGSGIVRTPVCSLQPRGLR